MDKVGCSKRSKSNDDALYKTRRDSVGDGVWDVYYGPLRLGQFDERHYKLEDALGRRARKRVLPMSPD